MVRNILAICIVPKKFGSHNDRYRSGLVSFDLFVTVISRMQRKEKEQIDYVKAIAIIITFLILFVNQFHQNEREKKSAK